MPTLLSGMLVAWLGAAASAMDVSLVEEPDRYFATDVTGRSAACRLTGRVGAGDLKRIRDFIGTRGTGFEDVACDIVYLESQGGDFSEAIEIMEYLFETMIATSVEAGAVCNSACAVIWLGGAVPGGHNLDNPHAYRRIVPGGTLGFHAPYPQLPDVPYSRELVLDSFSGSFSTAQNLLTIYQERKIPLWFASRLMHPEPNSFYYIDDIESANLIGAEIAVDLSLLGVIDGGLLAGICFNLSHWGKGLSAVSDTHKNYSRNQTRFSERAAYFSYLNESYIWQLKHKYAASIASLISDSAAIAGEAGGRVSTLFSETHSYDGGSSNCCEPGGLLRLWEWAADALGPDYEAIAPAFLRWRNDFDYWDGWTVLFPSPGVVGPRDENIRDRGEFCMISVDTYERSQFVLLHPDLDLRQATPVLSSQSVGTEFHPAQNLEHLPPTLIGLPADLKLTYIERILSSR
ncbi:hypothetical protein [Ruegeria sp. HKCCD8929]|uniref:hypothetical protein n=1 Tax=Ruegeria sp. HKCCD8929 TaxID=2683006 RepID=UPI00148A110E|nr:hypothetical protein [Ruegeria sp. HKCCD8929]